MNKNNYTPRRGLESIRRVSNSEYKNRKPAIAMQVLSFVGGMLLLTVIIVMVIQHSGVNFSSLVG